MRLAGVKLEKNARGKVTKVTLDMKHHASFLQEYLDVLEAKERLKSGEFVSWEEAKKVIEEHHGIKI